MSRSVTDDRIRFEPIFDPPYANGFLLRAYAPHLPADVFRFCIAEWIGNSTERVSMWSEVDASWLPADPGIRLDWTQQGKCALSITLVPESDTVDFAITVTNLTGYTWKDTFAFNCLALSNAPTFCDFEMKRTFICTRPAEFKRLADTHRVKTKERPMMQIYPVEGKGVPDWLKGDWFGNSPDSVCCPLIATVAVHGDWVAGMAADAALFLFNNSDASCIHCNNDAGNVSPQEQKTMRGRIYIMRGTLDDFHQRYCRDFHIPQAVPLVPPQTQA